jgi:tetratricopeptide (TPR) repeat protein
MPDSPNSADTLGWAYYQKGNYGLAIPMFEEAAGKVPNDPVYQHHLGLAYQKASDPGRAREHLERTLKIDPKYPEADNVRKALAELGAG